MIGILGFRESSPRAGEECSTLNLRLSNRHIVQSANEALSGLCLRALKILCVLIQRKPSAITKSKEMLPQRVFLGWFGVKNFSFSGSSFLSCKLKILKFHTKMRVRSFQSESWTDKKQSSCLKFHIFQTTSKWKIFRTPWIRLLNAHRLLTPKLTSKFTFWTLKLLTLKG